MTGDRQDTGDTAGASHLPYLVILLLLALATLPYTNLIHAGMSYALVVVGYTVFVLYALPAHDEVCVPAYVLVTLGVIWSIYVLHVLVSPRAVSSLVRVPAFVFITGINVLYLPSVIDPADFLAAVNRVSALAVIVGLPTVVLGAYSVGGVEVVAWRPFDPLVSVGSIDLYALKSFFRNPNPFGVLTFAGTVAALSELEARRTLSSLTLFASNSAGVVLSNSRSAIAAAVVGSALYLLYRYVGERRFPAAVFVFGAIGFITFLGTLIESPIPVAADYTGRVSLWRTGISAVLERPLVGWGPIDTSLIIELFVDGDPSGSFHNSYVRMFTTTGVLGGVSYLALLSVATVRQVLDADSRESAVLCSLLIGFLLSQLFESYSLFGLSSSSVLLAATVGYSIRQPLKRT